MENEFENNLLKVMKKFEGKNVKITLSGIIESKFNMKKLEYDFIEGILEIEDGDEAYLDIDVNDIKNMYIEYATSGYILLVLKVEGDMQVKIESKDENVIPIRDKILKWIEENGLAEEWYKKSACKV